MSRRAKIQAPEGAAPAWLLVSPIPGGLKDEHGTPLEWELLPFETEVGMRAEARVVSELLAVEGLQGFLGFSFAPVAPAAWSKVKPFVGPGRVVKLREVRP